VSRGKRPGLSSVLAFEDEALSCVTPQEDSMKKMEKSSEDSVVIITHQEPGIRIPVLFNVTNMRLWCRAGNGPTIRVF